ncbi:MAG TPA: KpsF/GutQ family sugar-phosphate isomerase [Ignavibacteria bacterium]|nr:KpsF/GutQ family sugar-phosphate isomerase [Ignavibacteria bacterium]
MSKTSEDVIKNARKVISIEKKAISDLERRFNNAEFSDSFRQAVDAIFKCKGKIVITGIGKSGIIAQKIVATFNSTGTYSIFLHSADSIHGDLGIVREDDVVILISKSGDTSEVKQIIPTLRDLGVKMIGILGNTKSDLADVCDIIIDASVKEEACPHNLAPTSSTTVALVIGDALAVSLLQKRNFRKEDFAFIHPGGSLGKKLILKVEDIMSEGDDVPTVKESTGMKDIIYAISSKRLGCAVVVNGSTVKGIITDGDIRRLLEKTLEIKNLTAKDVMSRNPKLIPKDTLAKRALEIMEDNKITSLIIADKKNKLQGILHIHKLIELGL